MTDDRDFHDKGDWKLALSNYRQSKRDHQYNRSIALINEYAVKTETIGNEIFITFETQRFGLVECIFNKKNFYWYRKKGKASGRGIHSLFSYFKPLEQKRSEEV